MAALGADSHSALAEFARVQVSLEGSEPRDSGARGGFGCHDEKFAPQSVSPPERCREVAVRDGPRSLLFSIGCWVRMICSGVN